MNYKRFILMPSFVHAFNKKKKKLLDIVNYHGELFNKNA